MLCSLLSNQCMGTNYSLKTKACWDECKVLFAVLLEVVFCSLCHYQSRNTSADLTWVRSLPRLYVFVISTSFFSKWKLLSMKTNCIWLYIIFTGEEPMQQPRPLLSWEQLQKSEVTSVASLSSGRSDTNSPGSLEHQNRFPSVMETLWNQTSE